MGKIKEQEAGLPVADICRKHCISPASFYKLKAKYGGLEESDALRLKSIEEENAKLKRLVADTMLDNVVLKDLLVQSLQLDLATTLPVITAHDHSGISIKGARETKSRVPSRLEQP